MDNPSDWNVLIEDDEPDNVGVLELVFDFHNATTRIAASGAQCLKMLDEELPTFVLVDIQMPEMSGFDLLKIMRSNRLWQRLPVIAVTAHATSDAQNDILQAGFDGYLCKPIDVTSLIDDLCAILAGRQSSD